MKNFEMLCIFNPDLDVDKTTTRIKELVAKCGGIVTKEDYWGKKRLAYEANGFNSGNYDLLFIEAEPGAISKLDAALKNDSEIIRHMIITSDKPVR